MRTHSLLALTLAFLALAPTTNARAQTATAPRPKAVTQDDVNAPFRDPKLNAEAWAKKFEIESREVYAARASIVAAVALKPGQQIADVGAGTGLFTALFAKAVGPEGQVYAVDIAPKFLQHIAQRAEEDKLANITPVLCTERSANLPPASIDVAFVCDTYHHFEHPADTLASIRRALRTGGRLVIVEFVREEGVSSDWTLHHVRAGQKLVVSEVEAAGFRQLPQPKVEGLKDNYMLVFERTANKSDSAAK